MTGSSQSSPRLTDHVVLISIDGLRPHIYRDDRWPAPVLHELVRRGAMALAVRSVFPALTYPAHTTIVTGALPARHGVVDNETFDPVAPTGRWIWDAAAIRVPTLWDGVRARGGTTAAISWPVTLGARIDWNVPDVWAPDAPGSIAPIRAAATPPGLFEELEREATGRLSDATFSLDTLGREDVVGAMAAYLFERYRPTLMLVHAIGLDHVRHRLGRDNPRARRAVAAADRAVARIVETVERLNLLDRTTFVVTGDHGSIDVHTALLPNVWLRDAGLTPPHPTGTSWRAAFHASGGSAFLRLQPSTEAHGHTLAAIRHALEALPDGVRTLFRVVDRAELDRLAAEPEAVLALAAAPGVVFSPDRDGPAVQAAHGAGHGYLPDVPDMLTGFVAAGAGVRTGAVVPLLPMQHIAPFIAALLGLDMPDVDGTLLPGLLSTTPEVAPSQRP
ncbi:MAG TPA: ectonucleotide pyrophosphatase/phosphodiesterase [Vicinamibacterales bacterium]|nr:ectonucleotide pyrophosphatase/phosphodiesterase [Vicinamibacterales bacterium]